MASIISNISYYLISNFLTKRKKKKLVPHLVPILVLKLVSKLVPKLIQKLVFKLASNGVYLNMWNKSLYFLIGVNPIKSDFPIFLALDLSNVSANKYYMWYIKIRFKLMSNQQNIWLINSDRFKDYVHTNQKQKKNFSKSKQVGEKKRVPWHTVVRYFTPKFFLDFFFRNLVFCWIPSFIFTHSKLNYVLTNNKYFIVLLSKKYVLAYVYEPAVKLLVWLYFKCVLIVKFTKIRNEKLKY